MELDYTAAKFWWDVFVTAFVAVLAIYSWLKSRHAANAQDIEALRDWAREEIEDARERMDDRHDALKDRVTKVERDLEHVPTQRQFAELGSQLGNLHGDLQKAIGELNAMTHQMTLVQKHLLRSSKGGD